MELFLSARQPLLEGRFDEARALLEAHLQAHPQDARGWGLLARCLRELGDLPRAGTAIARALSLAPSFPPSLMERGLVERALGNRGAAADWLRRSLAFTPDSHACRWELVRTLADSAPHEALTELRPLLQARPSDLEPALMAARLLRAIGELKQAAEIYDRLLAQGQASVEALEGAYSCRVLANVDLDVRLALARRLTEVAPSCERWMFLAQHLQYVGDFTGARSAAAAAAALDPQFLPARWTLFQLPATVAPESDAALEAFRLQWQQGLEQFEAIDLSDASARRYVRGCLGQSTSFFRQYVDDDVSAEQRRYGQLLHRMMAALDAGEPPRALRRGRRRIGVCSAHLFDHTVMWLLGPLLEALDRDAFDLHFFSLKARDDDWSRRLRRCGTFVDARADEAGWRRRIADAELDVLLYPEIGMDPVVQGLAALRLAPVQIALWGHPVTTGLPTIDLFLSPDAMESSTAEAHYTERLVRLPGLGHALEAESVPAPSAPPFYLDSGRTELLCAQTVFKLMPRQDRLLARVLAALPEARVHLLADDREPVCRWLLGRMRPTFAAAGVDPSRLCVHGFLARSAYLGLAQRVQLNLDSIGWSGGMSAYDLLAQGLPTVTLPGLTMRCRQTASLLRWLGVDELIARDEDDYVRIAVELARSPERRAAVSARLIERRDRLFGTAATKACLNRLLAQIERAADGTLILP